MRDKCFVIMPFGSKPLRDGSGRKFDFDKVYRVIIRRAVESAGMEPVRADEKTGSHIIHSDMFKELRDRTVVLADLSLDNPNVYYELGIRHVLSPGGTVLICREGTELPFDVRLSRVVFYNYEGQDLDWDVVEKVIPQLKAALETAKTRKPDSPIHALLERVFPGRDEQRAPDGWVKHEKKDSGVDLQEYQRIVAAVWHDHEQPLKDLAQAHVTSMFGARALGEFCLMTKPLAPETPSVARALYYHQQYDLSCELFEKCREQERPRGPATGTGPGFLLSPYHLVCFGSATSERDPTLAGADAGLALMREGLNRLEDGTATVDRFRLTNSLGGLLMWKWQLSKDYQVIDEAIKHLRQAKEFADQMAKEVLSYPVGRVAKLYLRLLVGHRMQESLSERADLEGYRDGLLALEERRAANNREASYLRWYKAIALADAGSEEATREMVISAIQKDAMRRRDSEEEAVEIGGTQYTMLRRFIEKNLSYLENHSLLGYISQTLQYASQG